MSKIPKFLICQNPKAITNEPFILHSQTPRFLCRVLSFKPFKVEIVDDFGGIINLNDYPFIVKRLESIVISNKTLFHENRTE